MDKETKLKLLHVVLALLPVILEVLEKMLETVVAELNAE